MSPKADYIDVIVETFLGGPGGLNGVHVRPVAGQPFSQDLLVECSRKLITDYPVGTMFKIRAKLTDRAGTKFIYSSYRWRYEVVRAK